MLFTDGARLAAQAGAWDVAWKAINDVAAEFTVNPFEAKLAVLESVRRKGPDDHKALVDAIVPLSDKAVADDEHDVAARLLKLAESAAKESKSVPLISLVQARLKRIDAVKKQFAEFKQATATLLQDPKDPAPNLASGKYLCFVKGDWDKGLAHLALGSDGKLAALARKDIAAPDKAAAQVEVGDGWWDLGEADQASKPEAQKRACHWYRKAEEGLTGLSLAKVQKRLETVVRHNPEISLAVVTESRQLKGHTGKVTGVAFTSDGQRIISASEDRTARIWQVKAGKEIGQFRGPEGPLTALALATDAASVCALTGDTMFYWDVESRKTLEKHDHKANSPIKALVFTNRNTIAIGHANGLLFKYGFQGGGGGRVGRSTGGVNALASAKDGVMVAAACSDGLVRLFNLDQRQEIRQFPGHTGEVLAVAISADGQALVSAGADKTIRVWNAATGQMVKLLKGHAGPVNCLAMLPDGGRILSGSSDNTVRLWDAKSGRELRAFKGHTDAVTCLAVSGDGKAIVTGSADKTVRVWDIGKKTDDLVALPDPKPEPKGTDTPAADPNRKVTDDQALLDLINKMRAEAKVPALANVNKLSMSAQTLCRTRQFFETIREGSVGLVGSGTVMMLPLAGDKLTAQAAFDSLKSSKAAVLNDPKYKGIGIGIGRDDKSDEVRYLLILGTE